MVPIEIVALLETATSTRLFASESEKLITVTNQRPERRSKRTRGSAVGWLLRTEVKKTSMSAFRPPSELPVTLPKLRMRLLTPTRNCEGPAAPIVSGGYAFVSARFAPRKLTPRVCGSPEDGTLLTGGAESEVAGRAARACRGAARRGFTLFGPCVRSAMRWRAWICAPVSW